MEVLVLVHPIVKLVYTLIILALLYYVSPHFVPFLVALVLAVLFEPVVSKLHLMLKGKRIIAVTVNYLGVIVLVGGLAVLGFTKIIIQFTALLRQMPEYAERLGRSLESIVLEAQEFFEDVPVEIIQSIRTTIGEAVNLGNQISTGTGFLVGTAKAIPDIFVVLIVTLVSFYLFSLQLPELRESLLRLFSDRARDKVSMILDDVNRAIVGFVRAQLIISLITYLFIVAGLLVLDVKYALVLALLIVLVDILPILGTGFMMLPWAAFLLMTGDSFTAVGIIVLYLLIIVLRRIIEPKILGQNIGLSPLTTVISMYVGFKVVGLGGIFLGPTVCIVVKAMRKAGFFQHKFDF